MPEEAGADGVEIWVYIAHKAQTAQLAQAKFIQIGVAHSPELCGSSAGAAARLFSKSQMD